MFVVRSCWLYRGDANGVSAAGSIWPIGGPATTLQSGFNQAEQAAALAQTATSADQWDDVVAAWTCAIATLHTIPPRSPERFFAQR